MSKLHKKACDHFFHGKYMPDLTQHVKAFLDRYLFEMVNEEMMRLLEEAKENGHYTVLLSSSPDFLVGEIAQRMGFHEWAGTEYSLKDDYTISEIGMLMEGEHKAQYVKKLMKKMEICKERITVYSDSFLDLPFLEAAGHPIAVNPDKKLREISLRRHWKII